MKRMPGTRAAMLSLALLVSVCAFAASAPPLPVAKPEAVGMSSSRLAKISTALKKEVDDGSFRGAVVMVARKGKLVYQDGGGMQTTAKPMTTDAIFRIYSMTKPLASVAAMMLVEDGVIQLTDPVGKFLPGFDKMQVSVATKSPEGTTYKTVPAERAITVQDLLRHTSGLAYGEITENAPVKEGLERAGVYRKDLDYEARGVTPKDESGGAGAVSTAADYLRFCQMMMNGGRLDGARILSPATVRLMTSDHLGNFIATPVQPGELLLGVKGYSFGLGFAVRQGDGVAGVPGSAGDYTWAGYAGTYFWVDPKEQITGVLMTQAPSPQRAYFRKMLRQLVYASIN